MKKVLYTLAVNNYCPEITNLTFPFMQAYADKIGADFCVITERKFPDLPPPMEKFQIFQLAQENGAAWHFFMDADTFVHPDFFDPTALLHKNTTMSGWASDFSPVRFKPDKYFLRDGRYLGKGNWLILASDWTTDIWKPLEDLTPEEAIANIRPTQKEQNTGLIQAAHLLDDYVVSRNIARYGLRHCLLSELQAQYKIEGNFLGHHYTKTTEEKVVWLNQLIQAVKDEVPEGFVR